MKFYLNEKKISQKKAKSLLSEQQIKEGYEELIEDPYVCMEYMTREGMLRMELN